MSLLLLLDSNGEGDGSICATSGGGGGWGLTEWGDESPWGTGVEAPQPSLFGVTPKIIGIRGGRVITLIGENFRDPMVVEFGKGGVTVGLGFIFDPRYDLKQNKAFVGTPALNPGCYDIRVTTAGGPSAVLFNAVEYRRFADEMKVQRARTGFAKVWGTGPRLVTNNSGDL